MGLLTIDSLPDPGDRYTLGNVLGTGVWAKVYQAIDTQHGNKSVAVKIQSYVGDTVDRIEEEYRILRDYSSHPNLPDFYGVYRKQQDDKPDEIWFILEYCEGGPIKDLINNLHTLNKKISEEHIAFILRETAKALVHLHKNHCIHRDVKGSNILLTAEGEIKLCDFGLARDLESTMGKRSTCIGSPCWMAPEMVVGSKSEEDEENDEGTYGNRADVWALGITAIELGDGMPPFMHMHPTRAMFQIVRNPPPTLYRPANWTQNYNDFIAECLEKNWENRPFMEELMEHPFFTQLTSATGSDHHFTTELKFLSSQVTDMPKRKAQEEVAIDSGFMKKYETSPEKMYVEDLAALEKLTEENIIEEVQHRYQNGYSYTFVGDVLLALNSNDMPEDLPRSFHNKYIFKSRSENAPHIFSVADSAYQDMLHHEEPQNILMSGESYSGKSTNIKQVIKHLCILGEGNKGVSNRVMGAISAINMFCNSGTPLNPNSTRCAMQTQLTFGQSGKLSGAIFLVSILEKLRVSSTDMNQCNFHIFYLFYDAMSASGNLDKYLMEPGRSYRYLRIPEETLATKLPYIRDDPTGNADRFNDFEKKLLDLEFSEEQLETIRTLLAAILLLGNVRYMNDGKFATVENVDVAQKVAKLLKVDEKKFQWALENYCVVEGGTAERRRHTGDEARDARDVLAGTLYCRLVDWLVNTVNQKFSFGRAVYGDLHMITLTDMFGFECFHRNRMEQLMINSLNEQIQYHYNQRMFAWEMIEQEEEEIPVTSLHYYDNKLAVDHLMSKPHGLFYIIDDASRGRHAQEFITESINARKSKHVLRISGHEFSVAHYTGKVTYDARDLADKNRDFLPPEMVETMRTSTDNTLKMMFTNKLSKTGNLTMAYEDAESIANATQKSKWGAALVAEKQKAKKLNTLSHGQYSQVHKMRTLSSVFRGACLEILKGLSVGGNSGNTHFVRCIRTDLEYMPRGFQTEMIYQQLRALSILDTAMARQKGYPQRVSFQEFLRRYKFLAFDFDENVDMTKDNCRLLLIRLKMEGWIIGKSKVFLKYYNVEYLSRLYETQVKKIIKVQSMMRAFLAKRNVASKLLKFRQDSIQVKKEPSTDEAAIVIQKAFRGFRVRQKYGPLINKNTGKIDIETSKFIQPYVKRWREKSMYQVLLHYRAARYQDLVNLSQQIHIFNQRIVADLTATGQCLLLEKVDPKETNPALLGPIRQPVRKLKFSLDDLPYFDTSFMCEPVGGIGYYEGESDSDHEPWDLPFQRKNTIAAKITKATQMPYDQFAQTDIAGVNVDFESINEPYTRDPSVPLKAIKPRSIQSKSVSVETSRPATCNRDMNDDFRHKLEGTDAGSKVAVYKKRVAPKLPVNSPPPVIRNNSFGKKRQAPKPMESKSMNNNFGGSDFNFPKLNPVKEMQIIMQQNSIESEDDAPFNFQGMLRKTKYQRASMKRSSSSTIDTMDDYRTSTPSYERNNNNNNNRESNNFIPKASPKLHNEQKKRAPNPPVNVVYQSRNSSDSRPISSQSYTENGNLDNNQNTLSINSTTATERRVSLPLGLDKQYGSSMIENVGTFVQEEIKPGVILEGYAVEI